MTRTTGRLVMGRRATGATRHDVLGYLIREADLDGLVTVAQREVGEALGITGQIAGYHIHNLEVDGLLTVLPDAAGYKNMCAIQLSESAEDAYREEAS
jgi:hypothetical protein